MTRRKTKKRSSASPDSSLAHRRKENQRLANVDEIWLGALRTALRKEVRRLWRQRFSLMHKVNTTRKIHLLIAKVVFFGGYRGSHEVDMHWLVHTQRFIPPKIINNAIEASQCECNELKLSDGKPLDSPCNTLDDEPTCLEDSNGFWQEISFRSILDFCSSNRRKRDQGIVDQVFEATERQCTGS